MKIQSLLLILIVAGASTLLSAEDELIAEMDERFDGNPELACRISYRMMVKVLSNQSQQNRPEGFPEIELAQEEVYLKDCMALPRMVQKCLVDQYAYLRIHACQQARQEFEESRDKI